MKTIYSIGRDEASDIVLWDDNNVISRTHAFLRIGKGGQYTITDQSMNGTYVNGMKIASGVEVPVKRSDSISFAHLAELDWSQIPNPAKKRWFTLIIVLVAVLAVLAGGYFAYQALKGKVVKTVSSAVSTFDDEIRDGFDGGGDADGNSSIFGSKNTEDEESSDLDIEQPEGNKKTVDEPKKEPKKDSKKEPKKEPKTEPKTEPASTTPQQPPVTEETQPTEQKTEEKTTTEDALF